MLPTKAGKLMSQSLWL